MLIGSGGAKTCALFDIDTLFGVDPKDQKCLKNWKGDEK